MDYRGLLLLWAARETGVLDAVTLHAGTPAAVADEADVTERAARITLQALEEMGFLERVGNEYEATNRALGFFAKTDVRSIGSVPHRLDCVDRWLELPETMRTGDPPAKSEDWETNFVGAMATVDEATVRACVTAAVHARPDAERVLDIGGGPGSFATEFARRDFEVTLFDRPAVVDRVERLLADEPVELVAGDATDDLPDGFDVAFCSRVAHALGPDENRRLVANAYDALEPGGAIVLVDRVRGRSEGAALLGAHMLAQTERGDAYTAETFTDWLDDAGFRNVAVRDVPGTNMQVIAGRVPRD
ncbi:class I SAM-dependent methyltransferase [Halomicrococcus sp. NG-SE-24]|uniref:class I SAM-dependent methyltransferase n=1 Tax=Halomicrococcus sp. NG-SE-24 TaxID=3436928 RepID=UPI003D952205